MATKARQFSPAALRAARLAKGKSLVAVGRAIGRYPDIVGGWELGRVSPQADDLAAIARYLGVDIVAFFPEED